MSFGFQFPENFKIEPYHGAMTKGPGKPTEAFPYCPGSKCWCYQCCIKRASEEKKNEPENVIHMQAVNIAELNLRLACYYYQKPNNDDDHVNLIETRLKQILFEVQQLGLAFNRLATQRLCMRCGIQLGQYGVQSNCCDHQNNQPCLYPECKSIAKHDHAFCSFHSF